MASSLFAESSSVSDVADDTGISNVITEWAAKLSVWALRC